MFDYNTKLGKINFSKNIAYKIITEAINSAEGKVSILKYKGKYKRFFPEIASKMNIYDDEMNAIEINTDSEGIDIVLYIVVGFGTSIKQVTNSIIDYIYDNFESKLGIKLNSVKLVVTGTLSKNIVKRNIEVKR